MKCKIKLDEGALLPSKSYGDEDAGWDLYYNGPDKTLIEGKIYSLPTGVHIAAEPGYWAEIFSRSSAIDKGYTIVRGIIDNGYRGELMIKIIPLKTVTIHSRDRLAQLIFHEIPMVEWEQTDELPTSNRQKKGFGSSGN